MTPEQFYEKLKEFNIELTDEQKWQLNRYYELLVEWNEKMNLTGITEINEVYLKHFYDSVIGFLMFKEYRQLQNIMRCRIRSRFSSFTGKNRFSTFKDGFSRFPWKTCKFLKSCDF